jgi:hypothetical protein
MAPTSKKIKIITSKPVVINVSPSIIVFFIVLLLAVVAVYYLSANSSIGTSSSPTPLSYIKNIIQGGDYRYARPPEPERTWSAPPDIRAAYVPPGTVPINIETHIAGRYSSEHLTDAKTRNIPETYQQMGIIKTGDGSLLPLYGRRSGRATDYYNYYTRTDTANPVQIPVSAGRRDCTTDIGCSMLMDGDTVKVYGLGEGHVKLYGIGAPRYIPGLV